MVKYIYKLKGERKEVDMSEFVYLRRFTNICFYQI